MRLCFVPFIAMCCVTVLLSGCAGHTKVYLKKDKNVPPLVVPSDVPVINQQPYFPVPAIPAQHDASSTPNLKPPTLQK